MSDTALSLLNAMVKDCYYPIYIRYQSPDKLSNLPKSHGWEVEKPEFEPRQSGIKVHQLNFSVLLL